MRCHYGTLYRKSKNKDCVTSLLLQDLGYLDVLEEF